MSRLPLIDALKMEKLLFSLGFEKRSQKGSHVFYRHTNGHTTTIPHHPGRLLSRPLTRKILRDIELSIEDYRSKIKSL